MARGGAMAAAMSPSHRWNLSTTVPSSDLREIKSPCAGHIFALTRLKAGTSITRDGASTYKLSKTYATGMLRESANASRMSSTASWVMCWTYIAHADADGFGLIATRGGAQDSVVHWIMRSDQAVRFRNGLSE